jgi:heme exporter protein B
LLTSVFALLKYDFQREFRQRLSFLSILLYVFSITYLMYFLLNTQGALVKMEVKYWNVIFWIIILFTTINELISQFSKESDGLYLYYYTVIHPSHFIISRLIFHAVYAALISLLTYFIFSLWFGSPVENFSLILLSILLGSSSFAILFTLTTAISKGLKNNAVLTSILGFPLSIPLITLVSRLSKEAFFITTSDNFWINLSVLIGFNLIMVVLSVILYPYIWRE